MFAGNQDHSQKFRHLDVQYIDLKRNHSIYVTYIYSPFCFYAHLFDKTSEINIFEEEIQHFYNLNETENMVIRNPLISELCMARFKEDGRWYRSRVKAVDTKKNLVLVNFIDYGNDEVVSLDTETLLRIDEKFLHYPKMALQLCLCDVYPTENQNHLVQEKTVDLMLRFLENPVEAKFISGTFDCFVVKVNISIMNTVVDLASELHRLDFLRIINK